MDHETMAHGCPWRVMARRKWVCKALVGQPNGNNCNKNNCGGLHIADLMLNEFREEMYKILGDSNGNATGITMSSRGDKS